MKRSGVNHALAVIEILLATSQSILARLGTQLDDFITETEGAVKATCAQVHKLMKDYQSAKWVVNRHAIDIVSQTMDLSSGSGFMAPNPLSQLYRDVRLEPFMPPYSPIDAPEYMGKVLLSDFPDA